MSLFSKPEPEPGPGPPPNQNQMPMYYRSEPEPPRAPSENPLKFAILLAGTAGLLLGLVLHICGITTLNWSVKEVEDIKVTFKNQETNQTKNESISSYDLESPWTSCSDKIASTYSDVIVQLLRLNYLQGQLVYLVIDEQFELGECKDIFISDGCRDDFASVEGKCTKYSSVRVFSHIGLILGAAALLLAILSTATTGKYQQGIALVTAALGLAAFLTVFIAVCVWGSYHGGLQEELIRQLNEQSKSLAKYPKTEEEIKDTKIEGKGFKEIFGTMYNRRLSPADLRQLNKDLKVLEKEIIRILKQTTWTLGGSFVMSTLGSLSMAGGAVLVAGGALFMRS